MLESKMGWSKPLLAGLVLLMHLSGCGIDAGFNPAPADRKTSATFRTEMEWIPNARMVRQDTMPRWQAGRFAFVRGSDQILVLTHITSLADWDQRREQFVNRKDHAMERLWIQIPDTTRLGDVLDAERLEARYMVGYDAGLIGDGQFIEPWKATGSLVLLEDHPDKMMIHANLLIAPKRRPNWSVQGVFEVQKNAQGIHAQPLPLDIREAYLGTSVIGQAIQSTSASPVHAEDKFTPKPASEPEAPQSTPTKEPAVNQDDNLGAGDTPAGQEQALAAKSIVGPWINQTPKWYERYQFNADGTFVHANCRPGYDPAINTGTWQIRNNQFLVLTITAYTYGRIGAKSVDSSLLKGPDVGVLRMTWIGDDLHLEGTVWRRGREPLNMTFTRGHFPDMATIPPPRQW